MLGDGSDGDLHITSGQTVNLLLDHKYQFKSITIDAGGTLSTSSTVGSVLYLCCQNTANIQGNIVLNGKVNPGMNNWSVTIDGQTFTSPSCNLGGLGSYWTSLGPTASRNGYGSGGGGGSYGNNLSRGGDGDSNGGGGGGGAPQLDTGNTNNNTVIQTGGTGGISGGGGGGNYANITFTGTNATGHSVAYHAGNGGGAYGGNGGDAPNPPGYQEILNVNSGGGSYSYYYASAGGGGGGGMAGRPGVHLCIRAGEVLFGDATNMNLSGSNGGNGGNGGVSYNPSGPEAGGLGGGGGGGGNSGSYYIYYGANYFTTANALAYRSGGAGGAGGLRGYSGTSSGGVGGAGAAGVAGSFFLFRGEAHYGNMLMFFN